MKITPLRALVAVTLVSLVAVGVNHSLVRWRIRHRQPSKEFVARSDRPEAVFQHTACLNWKTDADDHFYGIAVGHVDFDPIMPDLTYEHSYSLEDGGKLIVNGTPIEYSPEKRILALNPFGQMEEITLSESEAQVVATDSKRIWESVVVPRLYQFQGLLDNGRRNGTWICLDKSGKKAFEGDYADGKRGGQWTYFYPSGEVRAIIHYQNGMRQGKWTYFARDGAQESVLTWNKDIPVERSARQVGLDFEEVVYPDGRRIGQTGTFLR
jgi:hypothetical protein